MSTTIPAGSSAGRRKVASTTKVAPCSRWAGPNTAPGRLCATIMWSWTVTLNTGSHPVVVDRVAEGGQPAVREPRHDLGQLGERRGAGEECVEGRVVQQVAPAGGRHRAHLARPHVEPARVEVAAQRHGHLPVAVPAELENGPLCPEQAERALEPRGRRAGVQDEVATS